jgi:alpha-galactosidase
MMHLWLVSSHPPDYRSMSITIKRMAIAALGGLILCSAAPAAETVRVSDLDLRVKQDFGEVHRDQSVDGNPLTIAGQKFDHGFGTHANSVMRLGLGGKAESFTAKVGVDDELTDVGTITFTLTGDGKKLWESGAMNFGDAPQSVTVDLHGVQTLVLGARDGGDGNNHNHADWADATIVMTGGKPVMLDPEGKDAPAPAATNTVPAK